MIGNMRTVVSILSVVALTCTAAAQAEDVVRLGNLKFAHYGAVSYMKEICSKYDIKVDERFFSKGPDIITAIASGDIDLAALASDGAISGRANGVPIYTVAGFAKGGARLVSGAESGIKTMKDLKGKKVGVTRGGMQELLLYAELEKEGLTWSDKPGKDVQVVFLAFADLNLALANKQIDAMCQSEPQASQAINNKTGIELLKPYNTAIGEPYRLLVMSEKLYNNKNVALRVMQCFVDATTRFIKDPNVAEKYVRDNMFKGQLKAEDFHDAMDNADYTYDVPLAHIDTVTSFMQRFGVGKMANPPKAADWVKLEMLQEAKAKLGVRP